MKRQTKKLVIILFIISAVVAIASTVFVYMQYTDVLRASSSFSVPMH